MKIYLYIFIHNRLVKITHRASLPSTRIDSICRHRKLFSSENEVAHDFRGNNEGRKYDFW